MQTAINNNRAIFGTLVLAVTLSAAPVSAGKKSEYVYDEAVEKAKKKQVKEGWGGTLRLAANVSLGHSSSVVGKTDGLSASLGADIAGNLEYARGPHEWRNSLQFSELFSKTPGIERVVKSADKLALESIYLYHIKPLPWFGPFGRVYFESALFPGYDVRPKEVNYKVTGLDGQTIAARSGKDDSFKLSDTFRPLIFKESVGAFARPFSDPGFQLEFRLGVGGRQVVADDQFVVTKVDGDDVLISEVESYAEAGGEVAAYVWGHYYDNKVAYKVGAEVLVPFASTGDNSDKSTADLISVEFSAKLSFKLVSWASVDYQLSAVRLPKLQQDWQIQNNLFLSFAYANFWGTHVPEPKPAK